MTELLRTVTFQKPNGKKYTINAPNKSLLVVTPEEHERRKLYDECISAGHRVVGEGGPGKTYEISGSKPPWFERKFDHKKIVDSNDQAYLTLEHEEEGRVLLRVWNKALADRSAPDRDDHGFLYDIQGEEAYHTLRQIRARAEHKAEQASARFNESIDQALDKAPVSAEPRREDPPDIKPPDLGLAEDKLTAKEQADQAAAKAAAKPTDAKKGGR